jgi:diacylglycerol kinase family enzyme
VQIDGDAWGKTPIEIGVQPRVVPMLVPDAVSAGS